VEIKFLAMMEGSGKSALVYLAQEPTALTNTAVVKRKGVAEGKSRKRDWLVHLPLNPTA